MNTSSINRNTIKNKDMAHAMQEEKAKSCRRKDEGERTSENDQEKLPKGGGV